MDNLLDCKDLFLILLILVFSFAIFGLQPLAGNNVIYIPFIEHLQDKSLYSKDLLIQALEYHPTLFFKLIKTLSNASSVSVKELLIFSSWTIFILQAIIIFKISQLLFKNKKVSYLLLFFLLSPKSSLALEPIGLNPGQVTPSTFSFPLGFLATYFFLKNKNKLSFFLLGLIFNFQPIITLQLGLLFSFAQIIRDFKEKVSWPKIKEYLSLYGYLFIGSLPIVASMGMGSTFFSSWFATPLEWLKIIKIRTAHHFFPSSWQLTTWLLFFGFSLLFYLGLKVKRQKRSFNQKDKIVYALLLSFLPLFLFTEFFSEILIFRAVMLLSLFRAFSWFNFFSLLYGSYYCFNLLKSKKLFYKLGGVFIICLLFLPSSIYYDFSLLKPLVLGTVLLFFLLSLIVLLSNREKLFNKKRFFEPLFFGVFFFFLVFTSLWRMGKNYQNWGRLTLNNSLEKDWQELQLWVRGNTSSGALFITPPQLTGFRVSSQRSIIGEYKDGANFIYHPDLLSEWWKRMEDLGVEKEMARGAFLFDYQEISEEKTLKNLAKKYQADYLVSSFYDLPFLKLYNNTKFSVYRLN